MRVREAVKLHCGGRSVEVTALVDTGATTLVLPRRVSEELGVKPLGGMVAELADGTVREVDYGAVEVEVSGRRAPVLAAIVEGGEVRLGAEALERLGLAVDPTTGKIYPTRRFATRL
ncbi:MAG: clan AA aspartic protease [Thermofilum sp.]